MGVLHLASRSPHASSGLARCLERAGEGDAVLLLEGAVYAALKGSAAEPMLREAMGRLAVYALEPDLLARGVAADEVLDGVARIGYEGFVDLSLRHASALSWP
jgi:tRNA 2-thiouridine synthesizing protein B